LFVFYHSKNESGLSGVECYTDLGYEWEEAEYMEDGPHVFVLPLAVVPVEIAA